MRRKGGRQATGNESGAAMQNASNLRDSGVASRVHKDVVRQVLFSRTEPRTERHLKVLQRLVLEAKNEWKQAYAWFGSQRPLGFTQTFGVQPRPTSSTSSRQPDSAMNMLQKWFEA